MNPMFLRVLVFCFICLWIVPGLFAFAKADITFVSDVEEGSLFVACTTSDETVELVEQGDSAVFPKSNGGGVKCNVIVGVSRCAQSLQADLDPSSAHVDAKDSYTWTVTSQGISLDNQGLAYGWAPECFETTSLPSIF